MTVEYEDVVRNVAHTYWHTLLENDAAARAQAAAEAEIWGFEPGAAEVMINQFSRGPLEEWLAHQSGPNR